jgi:hypothetical protein
MTTKLTPLVPSRNAQPGTFAMSATEKTSLAWFNAAAALEHTLPAVDSASVECRVYAFEPNDEGGHSLAITTSLFLPKTRANGGFRGHRRPAPNFTDFTILDSFFAYENPGDADSGWQTTEENLVRLLNEWCKATRPNGRDRLNAARALSIALAARRGAVMGRI